jgi:predicted nucleic acid-binding protein
MLNVSGLGVRPGARRLGKRLEAIDGLLAATAETHQMIFVTRNRRDFEALGIPMINPWMAGN